jgi:predicted ATP-binding protein involved in virulence
VNQVLHLKDFSINLGDEPRHLLITGQNGSGKTQLIKAIAENLFLVCRDRPFYNYTAHHNQKNIQIDFNDVNAMTDAYEKNSFVVALYQTFRNPNFVEVRSIEKPDLNRPNDLNQNKVDQFLKFLADNKVQAALARNEGKIEDAEDINKWFESFEDVLRSLFCDSALKLEFDYTDYSFYINSLCKRFKFTQLSAGYAAALDIVADLILRMQKPGSLVRAYDKPGIVLIDEPETHLHLALQRQIMPILTKLFPNVQFIVATHSPFILSSLPNAVAYDLEHK